MIKWFLPNKIYFLYKCGAVQNVNPQPAHVTININSAVAQNVFYEL